MSLRRYLEDRPDSILESVRTDGFFESLIQVSVLVDEKPMRPHEFGLVCICVLFMPLLNFHLVPLVAEL